MGYDFKKTELKWQRKWSEARIFEPEPAGKKFFLTFPYPYLNGPLHIGHAFTNTRVESFARYKRMRGYNVLFPQGFHATGEPIVGVAKRVKARDEKQIDILRDSGVADRDIKKFEDPDYIIKFYRELDEKLIKRAGFSIDWRRSFITTDPEYSKFIEWQYKKLKEKGFVRKGTHPVIYCPSCDSPTGDHDRLEGEGVSVEEYTLIKFKFGDAYIVAATLRPETVYGQTNMWVDPDIEYAKVDVGKEIWIVSAECAEKLKYQKDGVRVVGKIRGREMIGKYCFAPGIEREIIILPSKFCDPKIGTGIVTSVPSDAPHDYMALCDLQKDKKLCEKHGLNYEKIKAIKIIKIINVPKYGDAAAVKICEDMKIKDQLDPKLEEAQNAVYKAGFHLGKMIAGKYAGTPVTKAKEMVKNELIKAGKADKFYEPGGKVVCRCTTECIVKILKEQWFLNYSNAKWKNQARECLKKMKLYPEEIRPAFENTIEWLEDKACARKSGRGTRLPWDRDWIIETLSDSTIYMAFYTIAHHIYGKIKPEQLEPEVFDYIFNGKNKSAAKKHVDEKTLDRMRKEFLYWYPMDFRNSADELVPNHLTFCIFHHCALFDKKHWPVAFGVNGMMMVEGQKMSKSKGNFITLAKALDEYGADATRINLMYTAEGLAEPNWEKESVESVKKWLEKLAQHCETKYSSKETKYDKLLRSRMNSNIKKCAEAYEETKFRSALQVGFFDSINAIKKYLTKTEPGAAFGEALRQTVLMIAPIAPHFAEEMLERMGEKLDKFPRINKKLIDRKLELGEEIMDLLEGDIAKVIELTKIHPAAIHVFVAPDWKRKIYAKAAKIKDPRALIKGVMQDPEIRKRGKEAAQYAQYLGRHSGELGEILSIGDEIKAVRDAREFLENKFKAQIIVTDAEKSENPKAGAAVPGKPAIFIE